MAGIGAGCVVLVPFLEHIDPFCEQALHVLAGRGYVVRRVQGYSAIDYGRSVLASEALDDGFDELLWIDSDIVFRPEDVERLRGHGLPFVAGVAVKKHRCELACEFPPGTAGVTLGVGGGVREVRYIGMAFALTRRRVYEAIRGQDELPVCNQRFGRGFVPYFLPMLVPDGAGHHYLTEGYAFCERARCAGMVPRVDTTIRLLHRGPYGYSWDDLAASVGRRR